ncbi:MAG: alpha/beta fold hydrolase [Terriglobia bacterium]|jgi:dienelactone hydrolase
MFNRLLGSFLFVAALGLCIQQPSGQQPIHTDKQNLLIYYDGAGASHRVKTVADWEIRRAQILHNMQLVMGPLPAPSSAPLDVQIESTVELATARRQKITYLGADGDPVPAYLFIPKLRKGVKAPGILCLHETTAVGMGSPAGLGGRPNRHYALELAERGFVTIAPDYPNFGDYHFDPYAHGYASATMKGISNHRRAVDLLQSLPEVNPDQIGVIGHSLGGHNSIFVAVFDDRIKAIVSSCGFTSFEKYYGGNLAGWSHKGYMPRIAEVYHKNPAEMPFDFTEVLAALAPRPVFINAPVGDDNFEVSGVRGCVAAALPVYRNIYKAAHNLQVVYPPGGHDFPPQAREAAYKFLARALKSSH